MESLLSNDPSLSHNKQFKNSKRKTRQYFHNQHHLARLPSISRQSSCNTIDKKHALPPHVQAEMVHAVAGGVFFNHYPKQFSLYSPLPPILPTFQHHHQNTNHHHRHHHQQQPPLLPLPSVSKSVFRSVPPLTRGQSLPPPVQKKQPIKPPTKNKTPQNLKKENTTTTTNNKKKKLVGEIKPRKEVSKGSLVEDETVGPDPGSDPKEKNRVLVVADLNDSNHHEVFCVSPPPSSLPLPKFTMRRQQVLQRSNKLMSCNAEAAAAANEVDSGATDKLCRLLKLR